MAVIKNETLGNKEQWMGEIKVSIKKKKSISKCVLDNKKTFQIRLEQKKFQQNCHVIDPGFDRGRNAINNDADDAEEPKNLRWETMKGTDFQPSSPSIFHPNGSSSQIVRSFKNVKPQA